MDWIEKIFGWNLDDGSVEFLIVTLAAIAVSFGFAVSLRRWNRHANL
jgi:hypothetical protein